MMINNQYKVETDDYNVILLKRTKDKTGEYTKNYSPVGYYPTIKHALKDLAKKEIYGNGLKDLQEVKKLIEELYDYIDNLKIEG